MHTYQLDRNFQGEKDMSGPITAPILAGGGPIEPTTSCHICDVQSPVRVGTIQAVIISENDGNVTIENADQPLSVGDTVEWCVSKDLKHKWKVQFLDDPLNSYTFNSSQCGFTVTNLPSGVYRYRAYVNGIANSALGSISIP